ncbi:MULTISPECIES: carboxylating nicotinate-nucleotide diphosphorylase [Bacillales]|jgi:nicotinate-nucleotide pyrophosphorylase (carboxylating)|uniref:Probable nicotinate-nucleotide pyrophosphorylase [carboxylating] n=1 Tax=Brevibacillus aydinogluensis TaxID=927786 RepID=A0AA48RJG2_9BACL|nr:MULTISPECIES: carboxylating nicotinate-nucleotide diphosphorylase [Bacillales]REK67433.1 MAG: carboxylating nicotinate-nucleotide diphosphorylase [Brevibacillus sp.]MBR8659851.1 carboxylating nicotinate-nucleotide diphosphorylase [Brevibacillus sp. NL20B1]MDT3416798.1 nicotinate-nucleotide pyrophosphorylase (carboxylating) [Brevibacillus aydinogluensis]NNV04236.1 carboxylating nicotinate-nucleotide diphosphorylase [Brevibacillus sp. MCWH]UFJ62328.1 carboxylating nicotinate-nucleotide diphos
MWSKRELQRKIEEWLQEDIGFGDVTTMSTIPETAQGVGILYAKEAGVIAGLPVAQLVFETVDPTLSFTALVKEGARVEKGEQIAEVSGSVRSILSGERLALNLLQRLSGIATRTSEYAQAVSGTKARVVDTRKTTPGLRMLEKYAVRVGGGHNHRYALYDAVMIKDNHIKGAGGIAQAVASARAAVPHTMTIEVETETLDQVQEALDAGADIIMLDNMPLDVMKQAVTLIGGRAVVEASGGVTLDTIRSIAETGVDVISVGALTHSVKALDISLDLNTRKR